MRRSFLAVGACAVVGLLAPQAASAASPFPARIDLPPFFQPEGIAVGRGTTFYAGSLATGAVIRGDLRTGTFETDFVESASGPAVGVEVDALNRVWVAGGPSGQIRVYDGETGEQLAQYQAPMAGFLNARMGGGDEIAWVEVVPLARKLNKKALRYLDDWALLADDIRREDELGDS